VSDRLTEETHNPVSELQRQAAASRPDEFPIEAIDYLEFWVGNAKQAAYFYEHAFGFTPIAYSGPETGNRDRVHYLLQQGEMRFLLTSSLTPDHHINRHQALHGDGVRDIALRVPDVRKAYEYATKHGARSVIEPFQSQDENGTIWRAAIKTYGDTIHTLISRANYSGFFAPGFKKLDTPSAAESSVVGLKAVDHVVGNVELGNMNHWIEFYERVMCMSELIHFSDEQITTEYSALMSKVLQAGDGRIKFPINEPAEGKRKSQIDEYLDFYQGPGVQHIALITDDIVTTVDELHRRGVRFLQTPEAYYIEAEQRVGEIDEKWSDLKRTGILVDRDDEGYLLQIFTKPAQDRPTVFFEIIQRKGARGFGEGNFKALFQAIEREQELRGNL
jgi:4-hydroxyphenylpyruvate dioxygenase